MKTKVTCIALFLFNFFLPGLTPSLLGGQADQVNVLFVGVENALPERDFLDWLIVHEIKKEAKLAVVTFASFSNHRISLSGFSEHFESSVHGVNATRLIDVPVIAAERWNYIVFVGACAHCTHADSMNEKKKRESTMKLVEDFLYSAKQLFDMHSVEDGKIFVVQNVQSSQFQTIPYIVSPFDGKGLNRGKVILNGRIQNNRNPLPHRQDDVMEFSAAATEAMSKSYNRGQRWQGLKSK